MSLSPALLHDKQHYACSGNNVNWWLMSLPVQNREIGLYS